MKIVVWLPFMDHHYSETWAHVQTLLAEKPIFVLNATERLVRKAQGWNSVPLDTFQTVMLEKRGWSRQSREIVHSHPDAIHVFFGFWGESHFFMLILYSLYRGMKVAIMNEPYSPNPVGYTKEESTPVARFKVWFRPILYRLFALASTFFRKGPPPCILPLSLIAREQFLQAGFGKNVLFPFGYFVPRTVSDVTKDQNHASTLRLVFIGSLLKRKGLDVAIEAVETLNKRGVSIRLDVYGHGSPENFIPSDTTCVWFKGPLKSDEVQSAIASYDVLILPSRHDGWGVVVNEALLQGTPVIVSDHVGAKCLLETTQAGIVFKSEDASDLAAKLEQLCKEPLKLKKLRAKAIQAGAYILPIVGAQYLLDVFKFYFYSDQSGQRPQAIWCDAANQ
ncbi:MAG TPA: glycosyltransferase family 4 protein [Oculatellaceae cyanobacterium]|nr:glycosyltransferase family 4 protein [Anaerolineales bacterium]